MSGIQMQALLNGRRIKSPAGRVLCAIMGIFLFVGLLTAVFLVALPLAVLGAGVALVGGLAAAFFPRLRGVRKPPAFRAPRHPEKMQRVEPIDPPRNVG